MADKYLNQDGLSHFYAGLKPKMVQEGIEFISGTQTAATNAWTGVTKQAALYDGMKIAYQLPYAGNSSAATLNLTLSGGTTTGAKTIRRAGVGNITTHYAAGTVIYLVYRTSVNIAGTTYTQTWFAGEDYDSTNLYMDYLYAPGGKAGSNGIMRNSLVMRKSDDTYESFTTTNGTGTDKTINTSGFYPGELYYYSPSSNLAAGGTIGNGQLYAFYTNILDARYSFNCGTTLTGYKAFYVVGKIQNGLFYLQSPYWSNSLPSTEDGKVYMLIGRTYDTYRYILFNYHPMFEYKNGALREYCPVASVPTETDSEVTGIAISNHSTGTVSSKKSGSNGSASTWAFTEVSIPNVTNAGSASSWTFEEKTIPNVTAAGSGSFTQGSFSGGSGSFSATVTNHVLSFSHSHTAATHGADSHTHTAPTLGTAIKVQSKSGGSNGTAPTLGTAIKVQSKSSGGNGTAPSWVFEDKTVVTSATHSITDNGHTHSLS